MDKSNYFNEWVTRRYEQAKARDMANRVLHEINIRLASGKLNCEHRFYCEEDHDQMTELLEGDKFTDEQIRVIKIEYNRYIGRHFDPYTAINIKC